VCATRTEVAALANSNKLLGTRDIRNLRRQSSARWNLAIDRTLDMADDQVFLLPALIDETVEASARVMRPP
jgi:hypothetical protein